MTAETVRENLNLLYVTTALIAPPQTGCMIRTMNIARQLAKCGTVTMLAVSHLFDEHSVNLCRSEFSAFHQIPLKPYSAHPVPWGEIRRKWDMHWPFSYGISADAVGQRLFAELAGEHDMVWFHTLGAAFPFYTQRRSCPSVMDLDDLNHCKYDLCSRHETNLRFRCSARVQSYKWKRHEYHALKHYDIVTVCSDFDKRYLAAENVRVVPNGFEPPAEKPEGRKPAPFRLGFIGTLGYGPNVDGLVWFRDKVWPQIRRRCPQMELRLIGSPPPPKYKVEAEGFTYLGYVRDPADEIRTWSAMIVPLLSGGGTRIKILEAFSRMCPVVATPVGAHGIEVTGGKNILLADEPALFAGHCLDLSSHPEKGQSLAEEGWRLFCERYTWDRIGDSIRAIIDELKSQKGKR
jgi:glycosyltransferase involved in cell wall biosynthesis